MRLKLRSDGWIPQLRLAVDRFSGRVEQSAEALARQVDWSSPRRNDLPTILCLDRALFRKDVEEMQVRTAINFVGISTTKVKRILERWVPPVGRDQTYFTKMLETNLHHLKKTLEAFGVAFLTEATAARHIDAVMAFQDKVTTERDDSLRADAAQVTITLKDGRSLTCCIDHCIGSASNPMRDEQLAQKFTELAAPVIGAPRMETCRREPSLRQRTLSALQS